MTTTRAARPTVLHGEHIELGARMAPFAGYDMPIQSRGVIAEHEETRTGVTVFDTCHMGEISLGGPTAQRDLEWLLSCRIDTLVQGRCRYGLMCNSSGGVIDDLIVYRDAPDRFLLVVNAGRREADVAWIRAHLSAETTLHDLSDATAKLDVQGPASAELVAGLVGPCVLQLRYFGFLLTHGDYGPTRVSRTGYTGELGFELYVPTSAAVRLWRDVLARGAMPAGLGARDTLRLEMGMPLYGHELSENRNAVETGFTWALAEAKSFEGSEHVNPGGDITQRLVGIRLEGRSSAHTGDDLLSHEGGGPVGMVTSGSYAPSLGVAVALAYVDAAHAAAGEQLVIRTARRDLRGTIVDLPFYRHGSARADLSTGNVTDKARR
jgi:aminomethyltransferase